MAVKTIYDSGTVKLQAEKLLSAARKLYYSRQEPSQSIVLIELKKAKADTLTRLCAQVDAQLRPAITALIKKAQKKLAFAEEINKWQREKSKEAIDPRIEKLMAKITQMKEKPKTQDSKAIFDQLFQWRIKMNNLAPRTHMSLEAHKKADKMIAELDMEFLRKSPQLINLGEVTKYSYDGIDHGQTIGSVAFAMSYIAEFTVYEDRRNRSPSDWANNLPFCWRDEGTLHGLMTDFIKEKKPQWRISEEDLMQISWKGSMGTLTGGPVAVSHPEARLSKSPNLKEYPRDASLAEIQVRLEALLELKQLLHLHSLGASVGIGHGTVAIVFHSTGRISLYNPCGDGERPFRYEANFGSIEQATEFLQKLTHQYNDIPLITLKPYCHENTVKLAQSQIELAQY